MNPPAPASRALLITDPAYDPRLRRAYPILNNRLPASEQEAAEFARRVPNRETLSGARATKADVLARWSSADCLYFACHMLQHPRLPFVYFIPLADPTSVTMSGAYLEPQDIREADLSRCSLAVLSGCSSAVPYAAPNGVEPSLGDVFLDAGARCVLQTLSNVDDRDAASLMARFAQHYHESPTDPVGALARAQRDGVERGERPGLWASYTAAVAGLSPAARTPLP